MFGELLETVAMACWIYRVPTTPRTEPLQVSRAGDTGEATRLVSGFSTRYKLWCFLISLAPKAVLALLLWHFGSAFILASENEGEVVLNTVAVSFVVEIDDLLYKVLVPAEVSLVLNDLPALRPAQVAPAQGGGVDGQDNVERSAACWFAGCTAFLGQYLNASVIILGTWFAVRHSCR